MSKTLIEIIGDLDRLVNGLHDKINNLEEENRNLKEANEKLYKNLQIFSPGKRQSTVKDYYEE